MCVWGRGGLVVWLGWVRSWDRVVHCSGVRCELGIIVTVGIYVVHAHTHTHTHTHFAFKVYTVCDSNGL